MPNINSPEIITKLKVENFELFTESIIPSGNLYWFKTKEDGISIEYNMLICEKWESKIKNVLVPDIKILETTKGNVSFYYCGTESNETEDDFRLFLIEFSPKNLKDISDIDVGGYFLHISFTILDRQENNTKFLFAHPEVGKNEKVIIKTPRRGTVTLVQTKGDGSGNNN